jgi:hypothetical protein
MEAKDHNYGVADEQSRLSSFRSRGSDPKGWGA